MNGVDKDVRSLASRALELGAFAARPLSAREVIVDPRVLFKCRVPLCSSYGTNLMCPPFVTTAEQFTAVLQRYSHAVVVQMAIPLSAADVKRRFRGKSLDKLVESKAYNKTLSDSQNAFAALLTTLETEALGMGYRFAAALTGGDCCLCDSCVAVPGAAEAVPCRHPFAARPSKEAVGIDVVRTAAAAGVPIEIPAADDPVWTGLLLVD